MNKSNLETIKAINDSGLFDAEWYASRYPDVSLSGIPPLEHFIRLGYLLLRNPHPLFDSRYYCSQLAENERSPQNPLLHYIQSGWKSNINPNPLFDLRWYLEKNPDISIAGIEPLFHFYHTGGYEGRMPHAAFPTHKILEQFPHLAEQKINPLEFYLSNDQDEDISPETTNYLALLAKQSSTKNQSRLIGMFNKSSDRDTIPNEKLEIPNDPNVDVRAIALYLPQYHAIPENDQWWGEGFTEWTNVRRATPQYESHYQPHIPHPDLGYYDLNDASVLEKQAAMAGAAGIEGFCFYYYWFNGRRLLNMPTDRMLATGKPDFPFCFCWANENWTRAWDGGDKEILIGQEHSDESDERFILDLLPAFRDPRYIRVEGKPLLIVYRPGLLPDPAATARHWRETCRREGIGEIFLARMQMFDWELEGRDPGFDTVIQFPPVSRVFSLSIKTSIQIHDPKSFVGEIYDYHATAENYPLENIGKNLLPGVCTSWDNTARRMERGHSWVNSSPEAYHNWLSKVVARARQALPPQQRFVFINAWNEWAEGCHLEPDEKYGYAWLNATRLALTDAKPPKSPLHRRVLVVGHDAFRAGAQIVLLALLREWKQRQDVECRLILLGDGVLRPEFENACRTLVLSDHVDEASRRQALANYLEPAPEVILANTVVIGPFLKDLKSTGAPLVTYAHELQKSIDRWAPGGIMAATVADSDHFIAVSSPVADNLVRNHGIATSAISLVHPYIKTRHFVSFSRLEELRAELGLQPGDKVVFGCGTMDWRKGPDLFAEIARKVLADVPEARFVWIGADNNDEAGSRAKALADHPRISFIGERETPRDYLALGSAFLLSSREDPFPLVTLEAADAGLPAVCFAGAGGMPDFVGNSCGCTVPFEDVDAATRALTEILSNPVLRESLGHTARESVRAKHDAAKGSEAVLSILKRLADGESPISPLSGRPLVSVIVPNYNHARFLPERLESIARQTLEDFEIILLDDCSTDDSLDILREFADREPRARLILNSENSGSTFKQWRKGLAEACGKYIWIAESDDSAHPELLATLVGKLEANPAAVLATCCPKMTDICGKDLGIPRDWFSDIGAERWESDFSASGREMNADVLSQKNAILNASGVLFRRSVGTVDLVEDSMRLCADWLFWVRLLARGDFEYSARPLNLWRLASSNARTKPPGETEWNEGKIVLRETASIMGVDKKEELLLLSNFRKRCEKWLQTIPSQTVTNSQVSIEANDSPLRTKVIAIHLPQFHPFKENNEWWGEGFTEWTNVRKNRPLFPVHAQPRIPTDLGYYDLRSPEVRAAQANLARDHGIDGFCYYHYWFHGHRLMTEPLDAIFESGEPDFPFCLCWANETWSRRWLGEERDILIAQTYSEADNVEHSHFLAKVFADKRYIRIDNRPLFIVYRPTHIDVLEDFLATLRKVSIDAGTGDPFILGCSAHAEGTDMRTLGMDGTMDFQPKLGFLRGAFEDNSSPERLARNRALGVDSPNLRLYDAKDLRHKMEEYRDQLDYPVHPSVFVGWDNTPRRGENGIVLMNNTPEDFANSFESATRYLDSSKFDGEKVVFINAWNEWAEGNYLEPDSLNGKKYLEFHKTLLLEKELEDISIPSSAPNVSNVESGKNTFLKQSCGWCPICEKKVTFSAKNEWLRDHYLCSDCGSIPRERALMHVIQERYPKWRDLRIHESSPGNRGASVKLREQCKHYVASQYDPGLGFGNTHPKNGYRSEDLEKQTFPEESFDIVVTQDVMEHIFDAESAFKDIHRTLKPGGAHIFTTPLVNKEEPTQRRAELRTDGTINHLYPPEYHGNPMSSEGSLVTFHWGFDIAEIIERTSSGQAEIIQPTDAEMGIEAEYIEVIVQKKQLADAVAINIDNSKRIGKEPSVDDCHSYNRNQETYTIRGSRKIKKIIIHIGSPKTGTSAVQLFLKNYCNEHRRFEVDYFSELLDFSGNQHHDVFVNISRTYNKIFETILNSKSDIGIFSAEILSFLMEDPAFNKKIRELISELESNAITVDVVGAVRDPLSYLVSAYGEDVIGGRCPLTFQNWLFTDQGAGHRNVIQTMRMWKNIPGIKAFHWFLFSSESGTNCIDSVISTCLDNILTIQKINESRKSEMIRKSFDGSIIEAVRRINTRNIPNWTSYRENISAYSYVESAVKEYKLPMYLLFKERNSSQKYEIEFIMKSLEESYSSFKKINFNECSNHEENLISHEKIEQALSKIHYNEDLVSFYFDALNGKI